MSADDLVYKSATALTHAYAQWTLSPVDVVRATIDRAAAIHAGFNIFAFTRFDEAMTEARAADARYSARTPLGPLDGVPVTVKDNLSTVGLPMTNACVGMAASAPQSDAIAWARLKAAGAILIGKTTTPEFAHKVLTDSPMYGITRSPWSRDRTPGGSSGGAAAAVAAGVGPIAVGTDGGGSIRCPASCSGVLGIKATLGRIPFESFPEGFASYAFTGPLARTVDDLALALALMSGPASSDPHSLRVERMHVPQLPSKPRVNGLRIGWIKRFGGRPVDPDVARLTSDAVRNMAEYGAHVEELDDQAFADVFEYYVVIATTAHGARLAALAQSLGERMTNSLRACVEQGKRYSAVDYQKAADRRTGLFRHVQSLFDRFDLLATPTMSAPPPTIDAGGAINTPMYADWAVSLYPFNLTGHPAASIPCGFSRDRLPVGLQLIGPWYGEAAILGVAAWMEASSPWAGTHPPI